ncbi:GNAT family N-acetyltransferase [Azospirillum picis]|uniref:GNAT family N-acyltransferase n=1 Tax=Azospirillum picis TaxID=488438 RepID=A0ABU0MJP5_9PROT|nr:GNAT family N-acetyltransferase [Azospirillum picis]MBP2299879.1 putative GNAT family N-acyltransferase [Azospirillum picis]MDQ0533675.1 putative GNAT family N-acyltransferase [Azospirillum picis]
MTNASKTHGDGVRPYAEPDRNGCLAVFDGNMPRFFSAAERPDFARFLARHALDWSYLVLERGGRIAACGGIVLENDGTTAGLCWGMVDRALHGTGLGTTLTEARLRSAAAIPGVTRVKLDTSQHTHGFYRRFGFRTVAVAEDGYGPGLDRYDMLLHL